jgi:hypothetical protein
MAAMPITRICASPTCPGLTTGAVQIGGDVRAFAFLG